MSLAVFKATLQASGPTGRDLVARDWTGSPVGPLDGWPVSLRTILLAMMTNPTPMFLAWGPGLTVFFNDAYRPIFADRHDRALGAGFSEIWADVWEDIRPLVERSMAGEGVKFQNLKLTITRNGAPEESWWSFTYSPVHDDAGAIAGLLCVTGETTGAIQTERRLTHRNEELEALVGERTRDQERTWALSPVLKIVSGMGGDILAVNPAWSRVMGWSEAESVGRNIVAFVAEEDGGSLDAGMARLDRGSDIVEIETVFVTRGGERRLLSWTMTPDKGRLYAFGRDITSERAAQDQLRQAQKMEAVGQLTGGLAHDFNNMLAGIIGALDLTQRRIEQGRIAETRRYIDAAVTSAHRAAGLTQRLLAFSRRQSLDVRAVDANALVAGMEDLLHRTLGENTVLETRPQAGLWLVSTDANQLESAILNLAINARDAMPAGGKLTIETVKTRLDDSYTRDFEDLVPGDYVVVSVSDTGVGMAPDIVARAFDPFFTTKPIGQGTGLGLSMIFGFARQSGGHARIYSHVGQGTTVKIYLPRSLEAERVAEEKADRPRAQQGECVLVVEDDPSVRLIVVDLLKELGYRSEEAFDAKSALPVIESRARIDLLITDVGLPGMNGRQLAEIARQTRPSLPVLFVTGYAEGAAVRGGFLDTDMDMVTKPFSVDLLAIKIRRMIKSDEGRA